MILQSKRLSLRTWQDSDQSALFKLASHSQVGPSAGFAPHFNEAESLFVIKNILQTEESFAICEQETGLLIGAISFNSQPEQRKNLKRSLGIWLGVDHWGKGYAKEASLLLIDYGFRQLDLQQIYMGHFPHNQRSAHLIKSLGFKFSHAREIDTIYAKSILEHCLKRADYLARTISFKGKRVLITGANGGIGRALIAELLAKDAELIYACSRQDFEIKSSKAKSRLRYLILDLNSEAELELIKEEVSSLDILINNAGINCGSGLLASNSLANLRAELEINLFASLKLSLAFLSQLQASCGTIVNICSLLSYVNLPANSSYAVSKAALHSMTQGIRGELKPLGIKVIGVYPGPVATKMTAGLNVEKTSAEDVAKEVIEAIYLGKIRVFPGEEAKAVYQDILTDYEAVEADFLERL